MIDYKKKGDRLMNIKEKLYGLVHSVISKKDDEAKAQVDSIVSYVEQLESELATYKDNVLVVLDRVEAEKVPREIANIFIENCLPLNTEIKVTIQGIKN